MAPNELPPIDAIRQLVTYDHTTGVLTWLPRAPDQVAHGRYGQEAMASALNKRFAGKRADGNQGRYRYRRIYLCGQHYPAHRVAWALHYGWAPIGQIDHINGDKGDNRIDNLRDVSPALNSRNVSRKVIGSSGILCISKTPNGRWSVTVSRIQIGTYDDLETAFVARNAAWKALGVTESHGIVAIEYRRSKKVEANRQEL